MQSKEIFFPTKDFYEVSNLGHIYATKRLVVCKNNTSRIKKRMKMKPRLDKDGYQAISLYENGVQKNFRLHRLVAEAFIPNPENKTFVNHKNGQKGDNRVENLEWCTQSENEQHAIKYLGKSQPKGEGSRLSDKLIVTLPNGIEEVVFGQNEAARRFGLDQGNIYWVLRGKYKQIKGFKFRYAELSN